MNRTSIEWTEASWNPVRGCSRVSEGCRNYYAEHMSAHFSRVGLPYEGLAVMTPNGPRWTNEVLCVEELLFEPLRWKKPHKVFVNSMSGLFHEKVPFDFIARVFEIMNGACWHTFQVLTKRSQRLRKLGSQMPWSDNIWMGVSVEDAGNSSRIDDLRATPANIKFLSLEPLLGPLSNLDLSGIDWVIVGGESGPGARPIDPAWVRGIRDQCQRAGVPFFFKQCGALSNNPDASDPTAKQNGGTAKGGRMLDGRTWDEMPAGVRAKSKQVAQVNVGGTA